MSIFQKLANKFFGVQYVLLVDCDKDMVVRKAERVGNFYYAYRFKHSSNTTMQLKPKGEVFGQNYVSQWRPLTDRVAEFFHEK